MSKWLVGEEIRHQVAIAGRVTDAQTGKVIAGAQVEFTVGPKTFTAADGHFHFLGLSPGEYTLQASLPGGGSHYGKSDEVTVTVTWDGQGNITLAKANLALPPLTGQANEPTRTGGAQPPPEAPAAADQSLIRQKKKLSKSQSQPPPTPASAPKRRTGKKSSE